MKIKLVKVVFYSLTAITLTACYTLKYQSSDVVRETDSYRVIVLDERPNPVEKKLYYRFRIERRKEQVMPERGLKVFAFVVPEKIVNTGVTKTEYTEWTPAKVKIRPSFSVSGFSAQIPSGDIVTNDAGEITVEVVADNATAAFAFIPSSTLGISSNTTLNAVPVSLNFESIGKAAEFSAWDITGVVRSITADVAKQMLAEVNLMPVEAQSNYPISQEVLISISGNAPPPRNLLGRYFQNEEILDQAVRQFPSYVSGFQQVRSVDGEGAKVTLLKTQQYMIEAAHPALKAYSQVLIPSNINSSRPFYLAMNTISGGPLNQRTLQEVTEQRQREQREADAQYEREEQIARQEKRESALRSIKASLEFTEACFVGSQTFFINRFNDVYSSEEIDYLFKRLADPDEIPEPIDPIGERYAGGDCGTKSPCECKFQLALYEGRWKMCSSRRGELYEFRGEKPFKQGYCRSCSTSGNCPDLEDFVF